MRCDFSNEVMRDRVLDRFVEAVITGGKCRIGRAVALDPQGLRYLTITSFGQKQCSRSWPSVTHIRVHRNVSWAR